MPGKSGTNGLPGRADVVAMTRVVLCPGPEGEKKGGLRYEGQSGTPSVSRRIRFQMAAQGSECGFVGIVQVENLCYR